MFECDHFGRRVTSKEANTAFRSLGIYSWYF